jgi:hypothetical protein
MMTIAYIIFTAKIKFHLLIRIKNQLEVKMVGILKMMVTGAAIMGLVHLNHIYILSISIHLLCDNSS